MAPLTGDAFRDPKNTGPRATKHIPGGGLFSAYGEVEVKASPKVVYDVLLNVGEYKEWNTFVSNVKITKTSDPHHSKGMRLEGGTCMVFYRNFTSEKKAEAREVVTLVERLKLKKDGHSTPCITRVRWQLDNAAITTPGFLLKHEQVHEIEEASDGTTKYRTWAVFAGPIAKFVRKQFEPIWRDRMQDWCRDLKNRSEEIETGDTKGGVQDTKPAQQQAV